MIIALSSFSPAEHDTNYMKDEDQMDMNHLTGQIISAAIEVHKHLGPGY